MNFLFFLYFLSMHRAAVQWTDINSGGSVVGKASTIGPDISPTLP